MGGGFKIQWETMQEPYYYFYVSLEQKKMGTVLVAMRHDMGGLNNGPRSKGNSFVLALFG